MSEKGTEQLSKCTSCLHCVIWEYCIAGCCQKVYAQKVYYILKQKMFQRGFKKKKSVPESHWRILIYSSTRTDIVENARFC